MKEERKFNIFIEVFMWLCTSIVIVPILITIITSFKSEREASELSLVLPNRILIENYGTAIVVGKLLKCLGNSVFISITSVVLIVLLSSVLAFVTTRNRSRLNRFIGVLITFGIIAPFAAMPTIKLLQILHIYGGYVSLIFVYTAVFLPFSTMLFSGFITTIPRELDEAGVVDGCKGAVLFYKIIFPLLQPVTITVAVLNLMWVWNDFQYSIYLINSSKMWTLPLSIYQFFGRFTQSWQLITADMIMVTLPIVILYVLAQKYIITGMTAGAVKG